MKGQIWTAVQQLKCRDWQKISVRTLGSTRQSVEIRNVRGWQCDKKIPETHRCCTGVSRRYRPFSITPSPKLTHRYSTQEADVFRLFSTAENSCGDPHSFDGHSFGRQAVPYFIQKGLYIRRILFFSIWRKPWARRQSLFYFLYNPRSPSKEISDNCLRVFPDQRIPYSSRETGAHSLLSLPLGIWM